MKTARFLVLLMVSGVATFAQGAATVDATGATPGSVTTIGAALAGIESEIIVKNTGVYHEALKITRNVILRGEDPNDRPVIAIQALSLQPSLGTGDGIYIGGTTTGTTDLDITFKDFIVIPATSNGPTDDAFSVSSNANQVLTIIIENVLCAPNDGSDKPLATSVWENPNLAAPGVVRIPDDGIYLMNDQFGGFDGDIVATLTDFVIIGTGGSGSGSGDAFVLYAGDNGSASLTCSGLGCSYSERYAAQISDMNPLTITGTKANPGWVARKNAAGLLIFQGGLVNIDNVISVDNNDTGMRVDSDTVEELHLSESLFANNFFQGVVSPFDATTAKSWTISDCTFFDNDQGNNNLPNLELTADSTANLTLTVTDCMFAGVEAEGIANAGAAVVTANNCGFVTAGIYSLPDPNTGITENNSVNADPGFVSVATDPTIADSFDVTASAYATASSTNGPLNGWGEGPPAAVSEWTLY